jgi:threonyl-tRNA synthetase
MINITLPDGSIRQFEGAVSGAELAASIGAGLAKAAIAVKVNGQQQDIYTPITTDSTVQILTLKDAEGLEIMRHTTTAQILARALKELYPGSKLAIGPTIDNGFYYDIETTAKISVDDLPKIEAKMRELLKTPRTVQRVMLEKADAIKLFESRGEPYKADIIINAKEDDTTEKGKISIYLQNGATPESAEFIDLCRGPHVANTAQISDAFKLTKISGAYWRGNSENQQLTRIYGVSFASKKELDAYLFMIEEAEKRDHRKIGREMGLFHIQEEAVGQVFWHDKGWRLYRTLENYMRDKIRTNGYTEVKTPILVDRKLWEMSGHWEKFREAMFISESEERTLAIKPMNCPCHVQIFNQGTVSYRDLPIRMAEFGSCHRNEPSGALHGIMRVRGFTQDDAHIFCMEDQIESEVVSFCKLLTEVYTELGFNDIKVKFSDRPEKRAGTDETWDKSEAALKSAAKAAGYDCILNPGEGAFYGPKLEFVLTDALGRDWQCGTLQVDFVLPERLDANYIGADDKRHRPVMLHRAIFGSLERFIGILIEQYAGKFPLWLAPEQVVVCPITNDFDAYAEEVNAALTAVGIRSKLDLRNEKIGYKIREHSTAKLPVIFAVGAKERDAKAVNIRRLGSEKQETLDLNEAITKLLNQSKLAEFIIN